tara:strand:- start:122 stop:406 length:285 start_codon:yes stop_codon:yes gene_type:complete
MKVETLIVAAFTSLSGFALAIPMLAFSDSELSLLVMVLVVTMPFVVASLLTGIVRFASWAIKLTEQVAIEHAKRPVTIVYEVDPDDYKRLNRTV